MTNQAIDFSKITFAYIGQISNPNFKRLKEAGVRGTEQFNDARSEYSAFENKFVTAYNGKDPNFPLQIPAWRQFTQHPLKEGAVYFLHPFASEVGFPPAGMILKAREAALECCDAYVDNHGHVTTVSLSPIAAIYSSVGARAIQVICDKPNVVGKPSVSPGAENPFQLHIETPKALTPRFQEIRLRAGAALQNYLQRPACFPPPSGVGQ